MFSTNYSFKELYTININSEMKLEELDSKAEYIYLFKINIPDTNSMISSRYFFLE